MIGRLIAAVRQRPRRSAGLLAVVVAVVIAVVALAGTGGPVRHRSVALAPVPVTGPTGATGPAKRRARIRPTRRPAAAQARRHLAIGLTEGNANLLSSARDGFAIPAAFDIGRALLSALHPAYVRVVINWAALQPTGGAGPLLDLPSDGCARGTGPCGSFAGLRAELSAIASQQRAGAGFEAVIVIAGVPGWAAHPPQGCERPGTTAYSRPILPAALSAYRALIRSVLALGQGLGVAMPWWAPWNEPNHPAFVSPQRAACTTSSPSLAASVYAELERSMAAELQAAGPGHRILLGELSGLTLSTPRSTSISEFVADLPSDVLCASDVWSVHAYPGRRATVEAPVTELESALNARGGCARRAHLWVTETGAGAAHAGDPRTPDVSQQLSGCRAMAAQLDAWYRDPRIDAAFQYEFREDALFPVGLMTASLDHVYPAYYLWLAWGGRHPPSAPPALPRACA